MRPTDEQALHALRVVAAWLGLGSTAAPASYDQAHMPPGATSRSAFLERHRQRVRDGVEGWSRVGQGRVVTAAAWAADVERETSRSRRRPVAPPLAANDSRGAIAEALGIRVHARPR